MKVQRSLSPISWILLSGTFVVLLYQLAILTFALSYPTDGVGGYWNRQGFLVNVAFPDSPLQLGDVVVAVNGRSVSDSIDIPGSWHEFLMREPGSVGHYTLRRGEESISLDVPWFRPTFLNVIIRTGPLLVVSLAFFAVTLLLLGRSEATSVRLVATVSLLLGLNLANNTLMSLGMNQAASFFWLFNPLDLLSFGLGISSAFVFLLFFPERKWLAYRLGVGIHFVHVLNLVPALVAIGGWSELSLLQTRALTYSRFLYPLAFVELVFGIGHLVHTYVTTQRIGVRNQIRWLMWGVILAPLPWLLFYSLPIAVWHIPVIPFGLASLSLVLIPVVFFLSITRTGLMAVDRFINRSLVYTTLSVLLIGVYLLVVGGLEFALVAILGPADLRIPTLIAIVIVALAANPLRMRIQVVVDQAFYRRWLDFKKFLRQMGQRLSSTIQIDEIVPILLEEIPERLSATSAALMLRGEADDYVSMAGDELRLSAEHPLVTRLERDAAPLVVSQAHDLSEESLVFLKEQWEIVLPLQSSGQLVGGYFLGPRSSGELYNQEELETLALLGQQVAVTVENARLYHRVEVYSQRLEELVVARTHELEVTNRELSKEHDRLNVILRNMADGLLVTSAEGEVLLVNPAFEAMIARPQSAILNRTIDEAMDCAELSQLVKQAYEKPGVVLSTDCTMNHRVFRALATALENGSGTITVIRDITHEVEVDRMKTEFISTVSHELRTPLTAVLGFTKLIEKSINRDVLPCIAKDNAKAGRALERIQDNLTIIIEEGERLTRLINDVLDVAKMEAGKIEWHDRPFDLASIIHQAIDSIHTLAAERRLTLRVNLQSDISPLLADPDRVLQVLLNLLSNAVKFTKEGDITISAWQLPPHELIERWQCPPGSPGGVLVMVKDSGPGIPDAEIPQLFQHFQQVRESTLTNKPKGTGLGLAICREIVTHYRGAIWVDSELGVGSTFQFVLPLPESIKVSEDTPVLPILSEIRRRVQGAIVPSTLEPVAVLVVDDDPNIRLLLRQELSDAGYEVLEAANGTEALSIARRQQPHIILLDVMMPDISGFDVTQILKSDPTTCDIPILILSIIEDREHGFALGADAYLTKPVDTETLLETILAFVEQETRPTPRAMVAGNDRSAIERITGLLREQGYEVVEAYDPQGAIATAQALNPDLVILDEMLSQLNDAEIIKALRFQQHAQSCSIIVVASNYRAEV